MLLRSMWESVTQLCKVYNELFYKAADQWAD